MLLKVEQFAGESEAVSARLLDEKFATKAVNCRVDRGLLEPLKGLSFVEALPISAQTIFRYTDTEWFTWNKEIDVVRTPVAYDVTDRVCYTGDGYPKQTRNDLALGAGSQPIAAYRLGVPAPDSPITAVVTGAPDPDQEGLEADVYYICCFVTSWGEEGPPSTPSLASTITDGQDVTLTLPSAPAGNYSFATKRIYRSNSGSAATAFQFLADVPVAQANYVDTTKAAALGEVIPSVLWDAPPDDDVSRFPSGEMLGIRMLSSGVAVGFSGNTLVYSEPYLPHAWAYQYPVKDKIVGIEATSTGVLITTEDKPYLAIGLDPQAISLQQLDESRACVSKRSMVDMGEYAIYASNDGLVGIENGNVRLLTEGLFRHDQWQRFNPSSLYAFRWEDKYVAFNGATGFIFTPGNQTSAFIELDFSIDAGYYDGSEDVLYASQGTNLYKFDKGSDLIYTWRSKVFQLPRPAPFSVIQVIADTYPVSIDVIRDGVTQNYSITSDAPQRLISGRGHNWQFEIRGSSHIHSVALAQSFEEIMNA